MESMSFDRTSGSIALDIEAKVFECDEAISRNPRDAKALRQRGLLRARLRRHDEALQDFDRALKLAPGDAHAYGLRALVWARIGDRERALRDFDEAIRLAPQTAELYRSHRERVLSETPRTPIEGGDFNILKNPFVLLGLAPTSVIVWRFSDRIILRRIALRRSPRAYDQASFCRHHSDGWDAET